MPSTGWRGWFLVAGCPLWPDDSYGQSVEDGADEEMISTIGQRGDARDAGAVAGPANTHHPSCGSVLIPIIGARYICTLTPGHASVAHPPASRAQRNPGRRLIPTTLPIQWTHDPAATSPMPTVNATLNWFIRGLPRVTVDTLKRGWWFVEI